MRTIEVQYHYEGDSWWADSDDVPGFSALGSSLPEARERVRTGLAFHLETDQFDLRETYAEPELPYTGTLSGASLSAATAGSHALVCAVSASSAGSAPPVDFRLRRSTYFGSTCPT